MPNEPAGNGAPAQTALDDFRNIILELVQTSPLPPPAEGSHSVSASAFDGVFFLRHVVFMLTSTSIFGGRLNREQLVAQYASLLPLLEQPAHLPYAEVARCGIAALKAGQHSIAQWILEDVLLRTSTWVSLIFVMQGLMRFLSIAAVVLIPLLMVVFRIEGVDLNAQLFEQEVSLVVLAALFGSLGGLVSLLMRLGEFDQTRGKSKQFLVLSGATQPLVGGVFAAVVASIVVSKLISVADVENTAWLFIVIGFASGFSERFTRGMLTMAEDRVLPVGSKTGHKMLR